ALIQYAAPANKQCRVAVDGIDYEYRVVVDGVLYQLDTCSTALPYESDLNQALEAIWSYLYDPTAYRGAPPRSLYDAAEDFLNDNLGVEPNE
ncbi:hypothetical protein KDA23_02800, partial [Candidatus Saccharibacteria bacterium]|nr:hypothetical protein [Candidatus Saccharibacteria bacterium]